MTVLVATGKVDAWRGEGGDVTIGDTDLVRAIIDAFPGKPAAPVTAALVVGGAQEMLAGDDIYASIGYAGYSEWTPGSPVEITLGEHDLVERLADLNDKVVTVVIADEPVDLAEMLRVVADE